MLDRRRHSSAVEQLFRKQQVLGSNPSVGSSNLNVKPAARAPALSSQGHVDSRGDAIRAFGDRVLKGAERIVNLQRWLDSRRTLQHRPSRPGWLMSAGSSYGR